LELLNLGINNVLDLCTEKENSPTSRVLLFLILLVRIFDRQTPDV